MHKETYSQFEQRLAVVPRWVIVNTIQKQTVDQHSFGVALIADRIARAYWNIQSEAWLYWINRFALLHDATEAFTGDIPACAKRPGLDKEVLIQNFEAFCNENPLLGRSDMMADMVEEVVKAADYLEAGYFLAREMCMGNATVRAIFEDVGRNFLNFMGAIGKPECGHLLWLEVSNFGQTQSPLSEV